MTRHSAPNDPAPPAPQLAAARAVPSLLADVQRHGPFDTSCLNCGGCSLVCELVYRDVTYPRKPIHHVLLGLRERVLEGLEPWLCHDCGDCTLACPRQADPAASMRTLRRYLTAQYDWTGLSSRILRSRAWHVGALAAVGILVFALAVFYHLYWAGLPAAEVAVTPMGMTHMFDKILYFTWAVYGLAGLFLLAHAYRMFRFTMGRARASPRHFLAEAWTLLIQAITHSRLRKCPSETRSARALERWNETPGAEAVPRRWLKHWLMAVGTATFFVLTGLFLRWFQTDDIHPLHHPQRWVGYLATILILWGTTDILVRRIRSGNSSKRGELALPLLLWLTAVSGIAIHLFRYTGFELSAHYAYAVHLAICVPMVLVEMPFGQWAHMIDRPVALYFQAVRERAREELPSEAGLAPVKA